MPIILKNIRFEAGETRAHYSGVGGYRTPADRPSAVFTFEVQDPTGEWLEMTTVVAGPVKDYNELVEAAYKRLANRLRRLSGMADQADPPAPAKSAEQGA